MCFDSVLLTFINDLIDCFYIFLFYCFPIRHHQYVGLQIIQHALPRKWYYAHVKFKRVPLVSANLYQKSKNLFYRVCYKAPCIITYGLQEMNICMAY